MTVIEMITQKFEEIKQTTYVSDYNIKTFSIILYNVGSQTYFD